MHDESLYFEDIAILEKRLERTKSSKLRNSLFLLYVYGSNDTLGWNEICIHHVKIINHNSQSLEIERYNFLESASLFNHSRMVLSVCGEAFERNILELILRLPSQDVFLVYIRDVCFHLNTVKYPSREYKIVWCKQHTLIYQMESFL